MKSFIDTITNLPISGVILFLFVGMGANAQTCASSPSCTSTISSSSASSVTITSGQVVCITNGYTGPIVVNTGGTLVITGNSAFSSGVTVNGGAKFNIGNNANPSGSITLNGGALNVLPGGTLSKNLAPAAASVINNCGTITGTDYNSNVTLNNYSSTTINLAWNGNLVNNFADNATINVQNVNMTNAFNNSGTGVTFNFSGSWNAPLHINNTGSLTVPTAPGGTIPSASTFTNSGTFNYLPVLNASNGMTIVNTSTGTMNLSSTSSNNRANITNNGAVNVSGTYYHGGGTIDNNGNMSFSDELRIDGGTFNMNAHSTTSTNTLYKNSGTVNMGDQSVLNIAENITTWNGSSINLVSGCASVFASTTESNSNINAPFLGSNNIGFCGAVPRKDGTDVTITSVTNSGGAYRVTITGTGPVTGDYVYITGITGNKINGLWQVTKINATTYDLIGSTFDNSGTLVTPNMNYSNLNLGSANYLGYSGCSNSCASLPISLVYFHAAVSGETVTLNWAASSEENVQSIVVQRSHDQSHFSDLFSVAANGNSAPYSEYDESPLQGLSYYRLKQINKDGSANYSSTVAVNFILANAVLIFPNPGNGNFNLAITEKTLISIMDLSGKEIRRYEAEANIQVEDFPKGIYLAEFSTAGGITTKQLVVQ